MLCSFQILVLDLIVISAVSANEGETTQRSCNVKPLDTHLWNDCTVSQYGSKGKALCFCVGCSGYRTIVKCNDRGQWELAEDDPITIRCSVCQLQCRSKGTREFTHVCDDTRTSNIRRCTCNRNCQEVFSTCEVNGIWQHPVSSCLATSGSMNIGAEQTSVNWRSTANGLELDCTNDYITVYRGSATCSDGELSNIILPICTTTCDGDPPNSEIWNKCRILQQAPKKIAVCYCNNCPGVSYTMPCNERGYWEPEEDFYARTEECLNCESRSFQECPSYLTCKRNEEKRQICRCYDNCQEVEQTCDGSRNDIPNNHVAHIVCSDVTGHMDIPTATEEIEVRWRKQAYNSLLLECLNKHTTIKKGSAVCSRGNLTNIIPPECKRSNSNTSQVNNNYFIIPTALLSCVILIYTIYLTVRKVQKHRMPLPRAADDDDVVYDEIDLRYAVEPPVPEPPPRVHDGFGYLLVNEPYQYDEVGVEKPLEKWINPMPDISDDVEHDYVDQDPVSHNVKGPENEDPMLHKLEVPEDVNEEEEDPVARPFEESEYVDHNDLHRCKNRMPNRPKHPDYVGQNELEQCNVKFSHKPRVCDDVDQNDVDQLKRD